VEKPPFREYKITGDAVVRIEKQHVDEILLKYWL